MKKRQPLGYQQQADSCWITSMMNAMVFLHGNANKIPNELARILYAISSKDGTENKEAERIVDFINDYKELKIKCEICEGETIAEDLLKDVIEKGSVIVADVQAGCHSVLITGLDQRGKKIKIFDPDWSTVLKDGQYIEIIRNEPEFNALVSIEEFFKKWASNQTPLRMGGVNSRSWIVLTSFKSSKTKKNNNDKLT